MFLLIVSVRARETASLVHSHLRLRGSIPLFTQLRERSFGELNGTSTENYAKVWIIDAVDPNHNEYQVERSVNQTCIYIYVYVTADNKLSFKLLCT